MAGNYADYNYAAEPKFYRYINEANISFRFSSKLNIEAGILPSHIGIESAIAKNNWHLSRSLLAENSPYFETGIKLNYSPNDKWAISAMVLQGWQNIKDNNKAKAFGTQVQFKPSTKTLINYSTFFGNEATGNQKAFRTFHNFYLSHTLSNKWNTAFLFDFGTQQKLIGNSANTWIGVSYFLQHKWNNTWQAAGRVEYYQDKKGVIISNYLPKAFSNTGYSINIDYSPFSFMMARLEGRYFKSPQQIFLSNGVATQKNTSILAGLSFFF
jgi:hypothetical protein